jgi:dipeptidyl aminopeptidase/acylaminoacyl peptidase
MRIFSVILLVLVSLHVSARETPIEDFARHPKFRMAKISPNGEYVAVTGVVDGKTMLGLIHLADMKVINISPRAREDINRFWWVAPDRVMYTVAVHFGTLANPAGTGELFTVKGDGTEAAIIFGLRMGEKVLPSATHIERPVAERATGELVSVLRDDPTHAIIASYPWRDHGTADDVFPAAYKIDLRDGRKVPLANAPVRGASFVADHHGVVRFAYNQGDQYTVYYRDSNGDPWRSVAGAATGKAQFAPLMFDRTGTAVYAQCAGDAGLGGICRWNIAAGTLDVLWSARESSQAELLPTFDGMDAFAIRTSVGKPAAVLLDKKAPEAAALIAMMKKFPGVDMRIVNASGDGSKVVFLASGDDDPGVFYLYETASGKATKLIEREPWIRPQDMAHREPFAIKARDGMTLRGYLTRPLGKVGARDLPLVVVVHGGPYGVWDTWDFDALTQLLASRGYATLQVNFRGSGGYGEEFMRAGYQQWGGKMQDDVTDATRWAIAQNIADPKRICIFGGSYGGYAALEGTVREPDLYQCAIGYAGIYDLQAWVGKTDISKSTSGADYIDSHIGTDPAQLWARSPLAHADQIKAKVLLVVGGADERVPKEQGENMRAALTRSKNAPEWLYERIEGHGFYEQAHVAKLYRTLLEFLDKHIGAARMQATGR